MKITKAENGWYKVENPPSRVLDWLRYDVPGNYRYYEKRCWYIHPKHVEEIKHLGSSEVPTPTCSGPSDYEILHLLPTAPDAIVDVVWRALAKEAHPDRGGDEETFKKLHAAYQRIKGRA